jgi:CBS domain-containing protein
VSTGIDRAGPPTVADVMVTIPWTHGVDLSVAQAREAFTDSHVHMLLLTDDGLLRGALLREDLVADLDPDLPALRVAALSGRTVHPDTPLERAVELVQQRGSRRLAVVDDDRRLVGLLCLKKSLDGFCSDADVRSRAREHGGLRRLGR